MAYINIDEESRRVVEFIKDEKYTEAECITNELLAFEPENPSLYYYMGSVFTKQKKYAMAKICFEKALSLDDKLDLVYNALCVVMRPMGLLKEMREMLLKAIKHCTPEYCRNRYGKDYPYKEAMSTYYANLGSSYVAGGTPREAVRQLEKSLEFNPNSSPAKWNLGLAQLELGDYANGFKNYEFGERTDKFHERSYAGKPEIPNSTPLWDGTKGQTVVVYGEQGIGDELMFASIIPDIAKDVNLIFETHPRLMEIFRNSFPEMTIYGTRKSQKIEWAKNYKIDAKLAIGSLGKFYRNKKEDFPGIPYLKANANLLFAMQDKIKSLGSKPKIGLSWKGGIGLTNKKVRSIKLQALLPLFDFDADFISLQYHCNAQTEIDKFQEATGKVIHHWQPEVDDYDLTAALVSNLDLVISVPQSVVHLAGGLGVKTWQLCPLRALWQMGTYDEDMPWYDSVKNFWQSSDGDWDSVVKKVVEQLKKEGFERC